MTRVILSALIGVVLPVSAQAQHGVVTYDFAQKFEYEIPEEVQNMDGLGDLLAQFPQQAMRNRFVLAFNAQASLLRVDQDYTDSLEAAMEAAISQMMEDLDPEKITMQIMALGANAAKSMDVEAVDMDLINISKPEATYVTFDDGTYVQVRPLLGRRFLVASDRDALSWKLTDEERSFLGHRILKATAMQDTVAVEAWFTPDVPVPAGPGLYGGLPGLILVLSVDGGRTVYTAREVDTEATPEVTRPTDGREVTAEEFEQIAREKLKEMEADLRSRVRDFDF